MNIMIINHYAGSEQYGMEFRPFYIGRELVKQGHDVTIIAADCSHLRKKNPVIEKSFTEEYIEGVRYVFVKTVKYKKNSLRRLLNILSFYHRVKRNSKTLYRKYKPNAIVASSTYPYDMKLAKLIAKPDMDIRVCFEIHDIWPLSLIEIHKISPNNPAMRHLKKAETYAYENADAVISILPHVDRHIEELGFNNTNYVYIPNGIVLDEDKQEEAPKEIRNLVNFLRSKDKFILMYLGGFSKANALEELIDSTEYLEDNIHIIMVGDGPLKEQYLQQINDRCITNITLSPSVSKTQVTKTLELADALYIGAKKSPLYKYGVGMNKIFDYMLSKRPIIYGIESSNDIISDADCGITITPEDPFEIARAAKVLSYMRPDELKKLGKNGYGYVIKNHNYKTLAKRFAVVLK